MHYRKQWIVFFVLCFFSSVLFAQDCPCSNSFSSLKQKMEDNYAGFLDKVTAQTEKVYRTKVQQLQQKAKYLNTGKDCEVVLRAYLAFFKDKHLYLESRYSVEKTSVPFVPLPADDLKNYFQKLNLPDNDIRGIWKNESYELAIIEADTKNTYNAIVISSQNEKWKKGMTKMQLKKAGASFYTIDYTTGDFELFKTKASFTKNILDVFSVGVFEKVHPAIKEAIDVKNYVSVFPDTDVKFSFPNDSTAILFFGSFGNQYEALIDSLMIVHKAELERRPYWIIDVSYNGGGGTGTYKSVLPYLHTNGIKRSGSYYRLSKDNVAMMEAFLKEKKELPEAVSAFFNQLISQGKAKPGSWFFEPGKTFTYPAVAANPKHVGVLVSNNTASSGEIFVMDAKQSKKVTVFGSQTQGMVDYGDGFTYTIGCDSLVVSIPTRKSEYLKYVRYEFIGLSPDVKILQNELMPYDFIMNYYEKLRFKAGSRK